MDTRAFLNPLNISVLASDFKAVETELVIAGLFMYEPGEFELIVEATLWNEELHALVMKLRTDGSFTGKVGKMFLIRTTASTTATKNVMLIGYGRRDTFSLDKMKTLGCMSLRNAVANGFHDILWLPTIREAGYTKFTVTEVVGAFVEGAMNEYKAILSKNVNGVQINTLKILTALGNEEDAKKGTSIALGKFES